MGWFDEQLKQRRQGDQEAFEDAFVGIAGAVMGAKVLSALNDDRALTKNAIDEILRFYHAKTREIPDGMRDMNEQIEYLTRPHGIMRRTVKLEKGWYKDAVGAMLAVKKSDGGIVALLPASSGYRYLDGETGRHVKISRKNETLFEPEAIAFYKPFPLSKLSVGSLFQYIVGTLSVSDFVWFAVAALAVALVGLLSPRLNYLMFSTALASGSPQMILSIAAFMASVAVSALLLNAVKSLLMARINTKMDVSVRAATMMRVLSLPADFFKRYASGDLASRAQYIGLLCGMLTSTALSTGLTSLFSLVYIAQIASYAPALAVPAILILSLSLLTSVASALVQMKISKKRMELKSQESGMGYALISGVQKIKLSGAEKRAFARWGRLYAKEAELQYNPPMFLKINAVISTAITLIGTIVLYGAAAGSGVSVADYYAFSTAYGMVSGAFLSIASIALTVANIRPILDLARPLLETVPEVADGKQVVTKLSGGIELSNVSFRYSESMPLVVDNLSVKIRPGQYVALVGATGCGKSTLMRLMLGFETPGKGAVYYDGKDLTTLDLKSLRRSIGVVMQSGKLFSGDIFSNITISAPWLTMNDAWRAAELAGIAEDIRRMPMGMHTMISEGSGGVSGGQRQRLMIARAIAPMPRILMFDEATSALDNVTQKKVSDALSDMKCTRIVIAHRLSTIRQCDRILYLEDGKIAEEGAYEELLALNGKFAALVERQRLDGGGYVGKTTVY